MSKINVKTVKWLVSFGVLGGLYWGFIFGQIYGIQRGRAEFHEKLIRDLKATQPGGAPLLLYGPEYELNGERLEPGRDHPGAGEAP